MKQGDTLTIAFQTQVKGGGGSNPDLKGTIISEGAEPDGVLFIHCRANCLLIFIHI